ncbi:MAG TPA: winged helix-turn-helix domain-containing protein [Nitrosopumilaceae archaeon]|jgi:DNA-binding transcriptional ArsR family regulator
MSEEDDQLAISDKVEILSTEDEKLKAIGEILSSDPSRKILKLLFNQALTANQISQKIEISLPLVIYHLKKMQESGVIKITKVGQNTKSHDMKFYTVDKFAIVILPTAMSTPAKKSKSLLNSFTRIHRMATLSAVCVAAWFSSQFIQKNMTQQVVSDEQLTMSQPEGAEMMLKAAPAAEPVEELPMQAQAPTGEFSFDILWSIVAVLAVIVAGLIIEILIKNKKEKQLKI